ncbi:MAG: hypothetical protein M3P93_16940 [Actinomycetota bacterium]|nr:hypothetical protein [Actinomycetota bacterium]
MIARKAVLVPLLVAALGGCSGGDPEVVVPPPLPEITAPPMRGASPTAAGPSVAAAAPAIENVGAFAARYYQVINQALRDGRPDLIRAASSPSCRSCASLASAIERRLRDGQKYRGGAITVVDLAAPPLASDQVRVLVVYKAARLDLVDTSGRVVLTRAAVPRAVSEVVLGREEQGWQVREVTQVHSS